MYAYHVRSLGAGDGKLQVGIFLPITEQQRELGQEAVVNIAHGGDGLGVGVAVDSALERFASANQFLPGFEVIRVIELYDNEGVSTCDAAFPADRDDK